MNRFNSSTWLSAVTGAHAYEYVAYEDYPWLHVDAKDPIVTALGLVRAGEYLHLSVEGSNPYDSNQHALRVLAMIHKAIQVGHATQPVGQGDPIGAQIGRWWLPAVGHKRVSANDSFSVTC